MASISGPRVVVAGAGPAAVESLLALRDLSGDRTRLQLIAPDRDLVVRAYEVLAPFREGHEHRYPLARIVRDVGAELVYDALAEVDAARRTILLRSGRQMPYDVLVVAIGARQVGTIGGATRFRGVQDARRLRALLIESHAGLHRRLAFVLPGGHSWPLPLYELALNTSAWLSERRIGGVPLTLVSTEHEPLEMFGTRASEEVASLLRAHHVEFVSGHAVRVDNRRLLLAGGRSLEVGETIATTRLGGPGVQGLPSDQEGFILVDEVGRVPGAEGVYAAGDATSFPVKQGGVATQHADAIARVIAKELGADVEEVEFRPTLRAVLYGGRDTLYLHAELGDRLQETSRASASAPWPEASKLVGVYLSPYLERLEGSPSPA